ncbi:MAG: hypothetical protein LAT67_13915 [Balneolales bacterium]|nr:hypothetical protein [Balneolales bacterium]
MKTLSYIPNGAAELYDFSNLYELRNACYNLETNKIIHYANSADSDEVISLLLVLEGDKRKTFIEEVDIEVLAEAAEDLHSTELIRLLDEMKPRRKDQLLGRLSDLVLYSLSSAGNTSKPTKHG